MGAITIKQFGGIIPRTSRRLIPEQAAQIAVNCRLSDGELVPFKQPKSVYDSVKQGPLLSIYRAYENGNYAWMTWPYDVDVVKAPLYGKARWCFTGDGEPRIAALSDITSGGGNNYPAVAYTLGTPRPVTAPAVSSSGGSGAVVDRYYVYTFVASWDDIEFEGGSSPISTVVSGRVDGTWSITGMNATPPNSGSATGVYASGETEFTTSGNHWLRVGEQVVIAGNTLTVTAVSAANKFKVQGNYASATTWERKAPFPGTITKRLYRTTGSTGQFQLVAENITGTSYTDTLMDDAIPGDELISSDWDMPPVGLKGLFILPSGALAGFDGNKLRFSEPYQPHAWPDSYGLVCDYPIVSAAHFGVGIAIGTESTPYIVTGVVPGQMSMERWSEVYPCLSKRSMVSLGNAALYASNAGLISISQAGVNVWTLPFFTKYEFEAYAPETMISVVSENRLYVHYNNGQQQCLIFNLLGDTPYLTAAHFEADDLYVDDVSGGLYFSSESKVYQFDPSDGYAMDQDWMSREIVLPKPANIGAARVNFDLAIDPVQQAAIEVERAAAVAYNTPLLASGNLYGAWNARGYGRAARWNGSVLMSVPDAPPANEVTFQLYTESYSGEMPLRFARTVTDNRPFNLPSGYKTNSIAVRVISQCRIKSIELGGTKSDLATTG